MFDGVSGEAVLFWYYLGCIVDGILALHGMVLGRDITDLRCVIPWVEMPCVLGVGTKPLPFPSVRDVVCHFAVHIHRNASNVGKVLEHLTE